MEQLMPWWAALIGLFIAIFLILKKLNPTYGLFLGAVIGSLIGGLSLNDTFSAIVSGVNSVTGTFLRVLAAGVLAGVMMGSGSAEVIAEAIVRKFGSAKAILSIALSTMVLVAVGVFAPIAVIIIAPIGLRVCKETGYSKLALVLALTGGGKAGNMISPNPNAIAAATGFGVSLSDLMLYGLIPALVGLMVAVFMANKLKNQGSKVKDMDISESSQISHENRLTLKQALITPVLVITLLLISPLGKILKIEFLASLELDAFFVLPFASVVGCILMGQSNEIFQYASDGLKRVSSTVMVLIGAGAISGMIGASDLSSQLVNLISKIGIPIELLSPIAGVVMSAAVGSTTAGVILVTGSFSDVILSSGIEPIMAAVMTHAGASVIDHLPHGNYFHVSAGAIKMSIDERVKAIGYEVIPGLCMMLTAILINYIF